MGNIAWTYKSFNDLSVSELYEILYLRNKVFIVEQNCPYNDTDGKDQASFHLCGKDDDNQLVAYARIIPPGITFEEASIGRVVSDPMHRRTGLGRELMEIAIEKTIGHFNTPTIRIGAQKYLQDFYNSLGFKAQGEEYLEDGIPHVEMLFTK
jgi:ElaA protein